ncbi:GAP family protein [Cellulosimicrobium arenosum]|uniref:GAP family protein n=1 Tax=Cellulosimicrobium arenosum TaxID=2708133 RepID=A0A927PCT2_9MICO|nr:GAP family protein [Cellulosimicrobium arenosum]MBD8079563.1 GAP family protein [Cellulosimicrobium arenosum]
MGAAIGQSLPVALGVMISPLPIVAVVLMLSSAKGKVNAFAFLLGWFVAVGGVALVVALLAGSGADDDGAAPAWAAWLKIVLGVLLLLVAVRQWQGRPRAGTEPPTPRWMQAVDTFTPVKAAGLAVLLGAINPKNLLLVVSGGSTIGAAAAGDTTVSVVAAIVFAVVASIGVALPVVVYVSTGDRAGKMLDEMKAWLVGHNAVVMAVLLLVIGAKMLGDGISLL